MDSDRGGRDRVRLSGIVLFGHLGVHEAERAFGQKLNVDLEMICDLEPGARSDALADTVDYGAVCSAVERVVADGRPQLLEYLAEQVAAAVLGVDHRVSAVTVGVRKLRPPVPQPLATSGVRIHRNRPEGPST